MNRILLILPVILALLQVSYSLRNSAGVEDRANDLAKTGASKNMLMEEVNMAHQDDDDFDVDDDDDEAYDDDDDEAYDDDEYGMSLAKSTLSRRTKE